MVRIFAIILILSSLSYAQTFYEKPDGRGYYQYFTQLIEDNSSKEVYRRPIVPPDEVLYVMPTERFQELFTATLNFALTERNLDTYADYVKMSTMANIRANEFGSLQVMYAQLNPPTDENIYIRSVSQDNVESEIRAVLRQNRDSYGFIYFYSPSCSYCAKTEPLLQMFQSRHGWEIERINVQEKNQLVKKFGITTTPSIRMVDRKGNVTPISNGLITLPEIEERAYRFIRYFNGETSDTTFGNFVEPPRSIK